MTLKTFGGHPLPEPLTDAERAAAHELALALFDAAIEPIRSDEAESPRSRDRKLRTSKQQSHRALSRRRHSALERSESSLSEP